MVFGLATGLADTNMVKAFGRFRSGTGSNKRVVVACKTAAVSAPALADLCATSLRLRRADC